MAVQRIAHLQSVPVLFIHRSWREEASHEPCGYKLYAPLHARTSKVRLQTDQQRNCRFASDYNGIQNVPIPTVKFVMQD